MAITHVHVLTALRKETLGCLALIYITSDPIRSPEGPALRKSLSLGNIDSLLPIDDGNGDDPIAAVECTGYHSDGHVHSKKGKTWSEEEHLKFLLGLKKHGKGDWRGIAKRFVTTRTPTQVASHAQKYFIRLNVHNRGRRTSLFDLFLEDQEKERHSQDASPSKQPMTGSQIPVIVQGQTQTEISNSFQNPSMEHKQVYQIASPYYPSLMYHPMYYTNPESVRFVHPSGIPVPRHLPIGMPQSNGATNMTKKNNLELSIGLPPPPSPSQATGATTNGVIHVK